MSGALKLAYITAYHYEADLLSGRQKWTWPPNVQQQPQKPEPSAPPPGYQQSEAYSALLLVTAFANLLFLPGGVWSTFTMACAATLVFAAARISAHYWSSNLRSVRAAVLNLAVACYMGRMFWVNTPPVLGAGVMMYISWTFVAYFALYTMAAVKHNRSARSNEPTPDASPFQTGASDADSDESVCLTTSAQISMEEAVEQAIEQGLERQLQNAVENALTDSPMRFDMKANANTLLAVTGVILYWRGVWTLWDVTFGYSVWSEVGAIASGLVVMVLIKYNKLPLAEWFPSA
ncbi:hypothetical protein WJX72_000906 [[Myrmecia] bisecta]|uniref:Uncharacterized protein n=1 Tax=[Myrmecia] bisecta TaxID=41462 RepID=A0AAW1QE49_9CHLO